MTATEPALVWLRNDLRIADNPALHTAVQSGRPVAVLYVLDDDSPEVRPLGAASRWWLHHSLAALGESLAERGAHLVLRRGPARDVVPDVVRQLGAAEVHWNRRYGHSRQIDAELKQRFRDEGLTAESHNGALLFEPWHIATGSGTPFAVFTPFWKACLAAPPPRGIVPAPREIDGVSARASATASESLDEWTLRPTHPDWSGGIADRWQPGERAAHHDLEQFVHDGLADYDRRDVPGEDATSHLSPRLAFGELSPHQLWHRLDRELPASAARHRAKFLSEVGWREFHHHLLFHSPDLATQNWRREWDAFPWPRLTPAHLEAWQRGRTGVPLVDAGMRELWETGYLHNRVRMVVASFLIKNLQIDWRRGEQWFWDTLVDADEANNPGNWQWVAGSGADAAPYFRVFNPELQAEKFDPHGDYVRRWVPEIGTDDYPHPIVDLKQSRQAALDAYAAMRA